jgi:hypothetical protein
MEKIFRIPNVTQGWFCKAGYYKRAGLVKPFFEAASGFTGERESS